MGATAEAPVQCRPTARTARGGPGLGQRDFQHTDSRAGVNLMLQK